MVVGSDEVDLVLPIVQRVVERRCWFLRFSPVVERVLWSRVVDNTCGVRTIVNRRHADTRAPSVSQHHRQFTLSFDPLPVRLVEGRDANAVCSKAVRLPNHVVHALIPPSSTASKRYNLRHRAHSLQLPQHSTQLSDSDFLTHKNTYLVQFVGLS